MKAKIIIFFLANMISNNSYSQIQKHHFEELDSLLNYQEKLILIYVYTDWCKYCDAMRFSTFQNDSVVQIINNKYYFIELDAEFEREIHFNNDVYKYKSLGENIGIHELAEILALNNEHISYPTICFLNTKFEIIFQINQFINSDNLLLLLEKLCIL